MSLERDGEIAQLKSLINELNMQTSKYELEKQNMRDVRGRLDAQIDFFNRIHVFSQHAFRLESLDELFGVISEGVVDIFQLEVGCVMLLDPSADLLRVKGSCNQVVDLDEVEISRSWLARRELVDFSGRGVLVESPVTEGPFDRMNLASAIYMPIFDNDRNMEGIIAGGISRGNERVYDFVPEDISSSFVVYCQQMNGICNNYLAIKEAKEAGEAKTRFLANLSHEIRTPMNAIIGMAQIAEHSKDADEIKKCIGQIGISSRHLLGLLNDVLDLSKIEEGKMTLNTAPFFLDAIIDNIVSSMKQPALDKDLELLVDTHGMHGLGLIGDSMRLSQVLINLISNAVKFTAGGGTVTIDVEEQSRNDERCLIRFSVKDTGIGMKPEELERIFHPFEQADKSTSRKFGGTGLGLSISDRIMELMGSKIKVDSQYGSGSEFYFTVWFDLDNAEEATKGADEHCYDFSGKNIMVVDDVMINREIIYAFMQETGANCEGAENGQEALDMFKASPAGYYDLILMDVQMPVMDGCEATRSIRALEREDAREVTIMAMTANVFREDMQQVADAGMNGHIGKPIEYDSMLNTIDRIFKKQH